MRSLRDEEARGEGVARQHLVPLLPDDDARTRHPLEHDPNQPSVGGEDPGRADEAGGKPGLAASVRLVARRTGGVERLPALHSSLLVVGEGSHAGDLLVAGPGDATPRALQSQGQSLAPPRHLLGEEPGLHTELYRVEARGARVLSDPLEESELPPRQRLVVRELAQQREEAIEFGCRTPLVLVGRETETGERAPRQQGQKLDSARALEAPVLES